MEKDFYDNFIAVIQKDNVGNIIDIIEKQDDCERNPQDYIVMSLKDAVKFKKEHPQKNFFVSKYTDDKIVDFLKANDCI